VADGARGRREAIRQLADLRSRLAAAEDALADALAATKSAEGAFDAASDRFDAAERALDAAREERAQARRERYAARQAHERAAITAGRLQRRVTDLSGWLAELTSTAPRRVGGADERRRPGGASLLTLSAGPRHSRAMREPSYGPGPCLP
jgi:chromosome segregation ATPase